MNEKQFIAEVIRALEDAEKNPPQPKKSAEAVAKEAWGKLQYDFPLVTPDELLAVVDAFTSSATPPLLTNKFIEVVQEGAEVRGGHEATPATENGGPAANGEGAEPLVTAYQKLLAFSIMSTVQLALELPVIDAANLLQGVSVPVTPWDQEGPSPAPIPEAGCLQDAVDAKLLHLCMKLSYHRMSADAAWKDASLLSSIEACLGAIRVHQRFLQLLPAAGALCSVLHDRVVSCPADIDAAVSALGRALGTEVASTSGPLKEREAAAALLGLGTYASLAERLPSGYAQRKLWQHIRTEGLGLMGSLLEGCQAQRAKRAKNSTISPSTDASSEEEEEAHAIRIGAALIEFFLVHVPPTEAKPAKLQAALIDSGAYRGLALAFVHHGVDPRHDALRRAVLCCCAASQELLKWAQAVPGFKAAWQQPQYGPGGELRLYGALYDCVRKDPEAGAALGELISSVLCQGSGSMPDLYATLRVMSLLQAASCGTLHWSGAVDGALADVADHLRAMAKELAAADGAVSDAAGGLGEVGSSEVEETGTEREKLARDPATQAALLAGRQAQRLLPDCLRMVKELRAKPGLRGKSD